MIIALLKNMNTTFDKNVLERLKVDFKELYALSFGLKKEVGFTIDENYEISKKVNVGDATSVHTYYEKDKKYKAFVHTHPRSAQFEDDELMYNIECMFPPSTLDLMYLHFKYSDEKNQPIDPPCMVVAEKYVWFFKKEEQIPPEYKDIVREYLEVISATTIATSDMNPRLYCTMLNRINYNTLCRLVTENYNWLCTVMKWEEITADAGRFLYYMKDLDKKKYFHISFTEY
jgi:hypothetical protein